MYVCVPVHVRVYVHISTEALQGQKRALGPLELQVVVSCHVVLGTEPGSSGRAASALTC